MDLPEQHIQTEAPAPYLFFFYDAGETRALTPVLVALKQQGLKFEVVVMGTARDEEGPKQFPEERIDIADMGVTETIDKSWQRTKPISAESLKKLSVKVDKKRVIIGCASEIQAQIAALTNTHKTIAYWDNFNVDPNNPAFETANRVQHAAQQVICPSQIVRDELQCLSKKDRNLKDWVVGGHPTLETWEKEIAFARQNKEKVIEKMGLKPSGGKIVTFIGGYGEKFEEADKLFAQCKVWLKEHGYQINQQLHPKVGTSPVLATHAVAVSDAIIVYDSTVGYQALFFNIPLLFAIPEGDPTTNFAIKRGFAPKISNVRELPCKLSEAQTQAHRDFYELIGVPRNSTQTIVKQLDKQ